MLLRINFRKCVERKGAWGPDVWPLGSSLLVQNLDLIFHLYLYGLIISFKNWFRDLLRELNKKYEVLLIILFLVFLLFLFSEGLLFVKSFGIASLLWLVLHQSSCDLIFSCVLTLQTYYLLSSSPQFDLIFNFHF